MRKLCFDHGPRGIAEEGRGKPGSQADERVLGSLLTVLAATTSLCSGALSAQTASEIDLSEVQPRWGVSPVLVEEVRIGSRMGAEEYTFGNAQGVAVLPNGEMWVGDSHLHAIRRYDESGVYIGQVGREGEGPGEFMYPSHLRVMPDGDIVVWDDGALLVTLFDQDGSYLDSFRTNTVMTQSLLVDELEVDTRGNIYVWATDFTGGPESIIDVLASEHIDAERLRQAAESTSPLPFRLKLDRSGAVLDSIYPLDTGGWNSLERTSYSNLSPLGYAVLAEDVGDTYRITYMTSEGRDVQLTRESPRVPYEPGERAEAERIEAVMAERWDRSPRPIPSTKPLLQGLWIDGEGRFWITLSAEGYREEESPAEESERLRYDGVKREWRSPFVTDVVHPSGEYVGRVEFPNRRTRIVGARGSLVWVVETGDLGEEYVVRYRIDEG